METKPIKIYKAEAYLINQRNLTKSQVNKAIELFTYRFYEEKMCKKCDNLPDRHNEVCEECNAYVGQRQLAKSVTLGDKKFLSMPRGGRDRIQRWLKYCDIQNFKIVDRTPEPVPFKRAIQFRGTLKDFQIEAKDATLKHKSGFIKSPPRSGKTVIGAAVICEIGAKTLILASQTEWLSQFRETFVGSSTVKAFTNAKQSQIKICKTYEDFVKTDICLSTFSKFMSPKGRELLQRIKDLFHVVIVDEAHMVPALETSRVLSVLNSTYRVGLTATPERKREIEFAVAENLFGKVYYESKVTRLRPIIDVLTTNQTFDIKSRSQFAFNFLKSRMESNKVRRSLVVKEALRLVKEEDHMVLIPLSRVKSILDYVREINEEAEDRIAMPFFGGLKKDQRMKIIEDARNYKTKIIVGNIALLSTGLNIPRASALFEMGGTSNIPKAEQRYSRVLTPMEGKPQPKIIFVLDEGDVPRATFRNEYFNALLARFQPEFPAGIRELIEEYLSFREGKPLADRKNLFTITSLKDGL
jgi:superfamily II DNA or RNA helicase